MSIVDTRLPAVYSWDGFHRSSDLPFAGDLEETLAILDLSGPAEQGDADQQDGVDDNAVQPGMQIEERASALIT